MLSPPSSLSSIPHVCATSFPPPPTSLSQLGEATAAVATSISLDDVSVGRQRVALNTFVSRAVRYAAQRGSEAAIRGEGDPPSTWHGHANLKRYLCTLILFARSGLAALWQRPVALWGEGEGVDEDDR